MSNFDNSRIKKEESRKRNETRREKLAGYFFDLSKLIFAGLVIGVISPLFGDSSNNSNWYIIIMGITLTLLTAMLANKIMK